MKLFKIIKFILTLFAFNIPFFLFAQWEFSKLMPFEQDGLWGYFNSKNEIIIPAKYEEAYPLHQGRGRIKYKGKYGYINPKGKVVIKTKYIKASDFGLNGAYVKKKNKTIRIDTAGNINNAWIMGCGYSAGVERSRCDSINNLFPHQIIKDDQDTDKFRFKRKINHSKNPQEFIFDTLTTKFDSIYALHKGIVCFEKNNKLGLISHQWLGINEYNLLNLLKIDYEEIKLFPCEDYPKEYIDYIALKKNGLWGFTYIPYGGWSDFTESHLRFRYKSIIAIEKHYVLVEYQNNKLGFVDLKGNEYFLEQ